MKFSIAIIGYGYWGPNLVRNFSSLDNCQVAYVCDQRVEQLALVAKHHPTIATTSDYQQVLATFKEVEALVPNLVGESSEISKTIKDFFTDTRKTLEEYINDVDCIDVRCKKCDDVEHIDYCSCGIIELDDKGEPILFYNKKNQIFLMEHGPQLFLPNQELKNDIRNLNLTNKLIRKCKTLGREQRKRYIELGKYCEEYNGEESSDDEDKKDDNIVIKEKIEPEPAQEAISTQVCVPCQPENKSELDKKKKVTKKAQNTTEKQTQEPKNKKRAPRKPKENKIN
jgi:hypothetical protein